MEATKQDIEKQIRFDLPIGQRALRAGFKRVTENQLYERFACKSMQDAENKKRRAQVPDGYKFHGEWDGSFHFRKWWGLFPIYDMDTPKAVCSVKLVALDSYIGDVIPDRVLASLAAARRIGLDKFQVAFPVIDDAQKSDPVLLAILKTGMGEDLQMLEIDMWE